MKNIFLFFLSFFIITDIQCSERKVSREKIEKEESKKKTILKALENIVIMSLSGNPENKKKLPKYKDIVEAGILEHIILDSDIKKIRTDLLTKICSMAESSEYKTASEKKKFRNNARTKINDVLSHFEEEIEKMKISE